MFTGIIQTIGRVAARGKNSLELEACLPRTRIGDSVAVNGACLTVRKATGRRLSFDVSEETWRLTNLGSLGRGMKVNLEPALRAGDPLGGHLLSGHVDARAQILKMESLPESFACLRVELPKALEGLIALKGSVTVDGVSLTITRLGPGYFESVLVCHTLKNTTLGLRRPGEMVNLEADLIARYVRANISKAGKL
jgi:riboflavin synthase alpha subunit